MNDKIAAFIFRTRGLYMFLALAIAMGIKFYWGGTTTLPLFIKGLTIATAVQAFRMYAASYLWGRQAVSEVEADFLCTSGPFAHIRNPLYLGNLLIGLALGIAINEGYAYALFMASYAFVYSIGIPYEESFLQAKFGGIYAEYKAHTGSLIPQAQWLQGCP